MKFGIRPKPVQQESLSGYLERVAHRNGFPFLDLMRLLSKPNKAYWQSVNTLDLYSDTFIDLDQTSKIVDLPVTILRLMTMQKAYDLYQKFSPSHSIKKSVYNRNRRFCPSCLLEGVTHCLFWQVQEINICDIHFVPLQSNCHICGDIQPYINKRHLTRRFCDNCESDLAFWTNPNDKVPPSNINEQLRFYEDWRYLLGNDIGETPIFESDEVTYCSSLLFICQDRAVKFNKNRLIATEQDIAILMSAIRGKRLQNAVTLSRTLKIIRSCNLTLEEFSNVVVAPEYLLSVENYVNGVRTEKNLGVCLAPWCKSYLRNDSMVAIHRRKNRILWNDMKYVDPAFCKGCSLTYGRNTNLDWEEIDQYISKGYGVALCLLEEGHPVIMIKKKTGLHNSIVLKWLGYFANRGLISDQHIQNYLPKIMDTSALEKMKHLDKNEKGARFAAAKRIFGWEMRDYFYYFGDSKVMEYFALSSKKIQPKGRIARVRMLPKVKNTLEYLLENENKISFQSVASALDVSPSLLNVNDYNELIEEYKHKQNISYHTELYQQAKLYISNQYNSSGLFMSKFYRSIGKSEAWVDNYFPEFKKWIEEQRVLHKERYKEYIKQQLAERAQYAIADLAATGQKITRVAIARHLRVTLKTVSHNPAILELIHAHYMGL